MTGEELKEARNNLGLTQETLGDRLHMTRVMVGLMEREKNQIQERTALAVWCLLYESGVFSIGDRAKDSL